MSPEELQRACIEAEEFGLTDPGFNVMVPGLRYGRTVRIAKGLSGANMGHYQTRGTEGENVTMVFLKASKVRAFLASLPEEVQP